MKKIISWMSVVDRWSTESNLFVKTFENWCAENADRSKIADSWLLEISVWSSFLQYTPLLERLDLQCLLCSSKRKYFYYSTHPEHSLHPKYFTTRVHGVVICYISIWKTIRLRLQKSKRKRVSWGRNKRFSGKEDSAHKTKGKFFFLEKHSR